MFNGRAKSNYKSQFHRVNALRAVLIFLAIALVVGIPLFFIGGVQNRKSIERGQLIDAWEAEEYDLAYSSSRAALETRPLDYFLLTINGFSAFQLGISQINTTDKLEYIEQCITSLRKAILQKEAASDKNIGVVFYVLGKAYYEKGEDDTYLAITYLEKACELSYDAADIPEYLGLAYARTGDYRSSVEAFSRALTRSDADPSDLLLLSIAHSYSELNEPETARAYLMRCIEISRDIKKVTGARLLLGEVFVQMGDFDAAQAEYQAILDSTGDNAEAYYQLGELYKQRGDNTQARAYWRLSLRADPAYQKARARLSQ